jgi:hypothetical protein
VRVRWRSRAWDVELIEDGPDHGWIIDDRDDAEAPAASRALEDVGVEGAAHERSPVDARHPLTVLLRQIAPRRPGADAPQDAIDDLPIVERGPALASSLRRQKGFEQTPLRFAQVAAIQSCLRPRGMLESKPESRANDFVNSA